MSIFEVLNKVNVNEHTEKKGNLTYLSWAWAWAEVKKAFPDATYTIYENAEGWNYFTDGHTCWVKTGVTINGLEHIEYLPVMNFNNKAIELNAVTSTDVNKAIQRSLTKACARHGLGLYIYAGEDLPEEELKEKSAEIEKLKGKKISEVKAKAMIETLKNADAEILSANDISMSTICKKYNVNSISELNEEQYLELHTTLIKIKAV